MTKEELKKYNVGENLDALMNLDPRGYGVCRVLYAGSRAFAGEPLAMRGAEALIKSVKPGDAVFIFTGFILLPHERPETDGLASTLPLARAIVQALGATPIIVCPEEAAAAVEHCAPVIGLHCYRDLKTALERPLSLGVVSFTKDAAKAKEQAEEVLAAVVPAAAISSECSGANEAGVYHTALGYDASPYEAKSDIFWQILLDRKIPTLAIGDLGNENGMNAIADHIKQYIPNTDADECRCDCKGGILAKTGADNIITATCSDWGAYALIAALAYLKSDKKVMPPDLMISEVLRALSRCSIVDMTGSLLPGVDGFDIELYRLVASLMRRLVSYALQYDDPNDNWFGPVLKKGFFQSAK